MNSLKEKCKRISMSIETEILGENINSQKKKVSNLRLLLNILKTWLKTFIIFKKKIKYDLKILAQSNYF